MQPNLGFREFGPHCHKQQYLLIFAPWGTPFPRHPGLGGCRPTTHRSKPPLFPTSYTMAAHVLHCLGEESPWILGSGPLVVRNHHRAMRPLPGPREFIAVTIAAGVSIQSGRKLPKPRAIEHEHPFGRTDELRRRTTFRRRSLQRSSSCR